MSRTTKKALIIGVVVLVLAYVFIAIDPTSAWGKSRRFNVQREVHGSLVFKTYQVRGVCSSGGNLRGWYLSHVQRNSMTSIRQYTFGPWGGSFCSTSRRITGVNWGGRPDGDPNDGLGWVWHIGDTTVMSSDNSGDLRHKKWKSHFSVHFPPIPARHDYPWLRVELRPGRAPSMTHGCGC
jgi:hypothetical protein